MKVIEEVHADDLKDEEQLTTKFMRDWRVKDLRILFLGEKERHVFACHEHPYFEFASDVVPEDFSNAFL